jgi:hypothetical protein
MEEKIDFIDEFLATCEDWMHGKEGDDVTKCRKYLDEISIELKKLNIPAVSCSVVHCKKAPYDVYIGRPSKWGNPFTHIQDGKTLAKHLVGSRDEAVEAFREWITNGEGKHLMNDLHELKDKVLGCWCKPQNCHGDVLSDLVSKHCN